MKKILFIFSIILLINCEKKDIYQSEISGYLVDQTTKNPIKDINIKLFGGYSEILGSGSSDLLAETTTNEKGYFSINKEIEIKDYSYYIVGAYDNGATDTNRISYNYYFDYLQGSNNVYSTSEIDSLPNNINFSLQPSGLIEFNVNGELSNEYDTVIIKTIYQMDTIFNYGETQLSFPPNNEYTFEMYYVTANEKHLFRTEKIFIPNNRSRNSLLHFVIEN
jgi:hypothetical protein